MGNTIYRENTSYRKNTFYTENTIYSIMTENLPTYPPRRHRPLLDDVLDNKASRGRGSEGEREKSKSENRKSDFSDILFSLSEISSEIGISLSPPPPPSSSPPDSNPAL